MGAGIRAEPMMAEGPSGMSADSAREIVSEHADRPCPQCRGERCWMLEWALKIVLLGGHEVRADMIGAVTLAARRIAKVHRPGDDRLCSPCLRPSCEPGEIATRWLKIINAPLESDVADARAVLKAHQDYGCPDCAPTGCETEEWAAREVFDAIAAAESDGPKTMADIERIANEMRGDLPQD